MTTPLTAALPQGLSVRGLAREYHVDRARLAQAIATGELPAQRLGRRRFLVLRSDAEDWLRRFRVAPSARPADAPKPREVIARRLASIEAKVERVLIAEEARAARRMRGSPGGA